MSVRRPSKLCRVCCAIFSSSNVAIVHSSLNAPRAPPWNHVALLPFLAVPPVPELFTLPPRAGEILPVSDIDVRPLRSPRLRRHIVNALGPTMRPRLEPDARRVSGRLHTLDTGTVVRQEHVTIRAQPARLLRKIRHRVPCLTVHLPRVHVVVVHVRPGRCELEMTRMIEHVVLNKKHDITLKHLQCCQDLTKHGQGSTNTRQHHILPERAR